MARYPEIRRLLQEEVKAKAAQRAGRESAFSPHPPAFSKKPKAADGAGNFVLGNRLSAPPAPEFGDWVAKEIKANGGHL